MLRKLIPPLSQFFMEISSILQRRRDFGHLSIYGLDLSKEHLCIHRTVRFLHVTRLDLCGCMTRSAAQLGRFITSFPSLRILKINSWLLSPSGLLDVRVKGTKSTTSLVSLDVYLVPNISGLLNYFIGHWFFLRYLTTLHLRWGYTDNDEHDLSSFRGVNDVFRHCWTSLESLTMTVGRSKSEDVLVNSANLCEWLME